MDFYEMQEMKHLADLTNGTKKKISEQGIQNILMHLLYFKSMLKNSSIEIQNLFIYPLSLLNSEYSIEEMQIDYFNQVLINDEIISKIIIQTKAVLSKLNDADKIGEILSGLEENIKFPYKNINELFVKDLTQKIKPQTKENIKIKIKESKSKLLERKNLTFAVATSVQQQEIETEKDKIEVIKENDKLITQIKDNMNLLGESVKKCKMGLNCKEKEISYTLGKEKEIQCSNSIENGEQSTRDFSNEIIKNEQYENIEELIKYIDEDDEKRPKKKRRKRNRNKKQGLKEKNDYEDNFDKDYKDERDIELIEFIKDIKNNTINSSELQKIKIDFHQKWLKSL